MVFRVLFDTYKMFYWCGTHDWIIFCYYGDLFLKKYHNVVNLIYMYTYIYMYLANTNTVHVYTCIINTESDGYFEVTYMYKFLISFIFSQVNGVT